MPEPLSPKSIKRPRSFFTLARINEVSLLLLVVAAAWLWFEVHP